MGFAAFFVSQIPAEGKPPVKVRFDKQEFLKVWRDFINGLSFLRKEKDVFESILLLTGSQALIASLVSLAPGFAHRVLEVEIKDASYLIMGPAAIGMVLGSLLVGQFGRGFRKQTLVNLGILSAGIFLLALSTIVRLESLALAVSLLFLLGAANALVDVPTNTNLQENTPASVRGRVYGLLTSFVGGAAILPVMVTGLLADLLGIGKVIFGMGGLILSYGIYRFLKERYNRSVKCNA